MEIASVSRASKDGLFGSARCSTRSSSLQERTLRVGTGCQWRALLNCFPPFTTVQYYFYSWRDTGVFNQMMDPKSPLVALRALARAEAGRDPEPTTAVLDSQSVKTTDPKLQRSRSCPSLSGGPRSYDAGKKIKGRKRQLAVDVEGLPIVIGLHSAEVQDQDSAPGPEESDLSDPRAAGKGSNGSEAVCRWWLCGSETSGEVKEVGTLRSTRDRGQTQGRDPKSPSLGLYRAISSLGSRKDLCLAGSLSASSQPEESVFGLRDPSESENPPFELLRVRWLG